MWSGTGCCGNPGAGVVGGAVATEAYVGGLGGWGPGVAGGGNRVTDGSESVTVTGFGGTGDAAGYEAEGGVSAECESVVRKGGAAAGVRVGAGRRGFESREGAEERGTKGLGCW